MNQRADYSSHLARHASTPGSNERKTLNTQVYAVLRELLIAGVLQPGEKLSLRSLAQRLGVSVQPVREAVARLIGDEALEVTPNRAVRVPIISVEQFNELTAIRLAIEGFAVETAARRITATEMTSIRRLDRLFRKQCGSRAPDLEVAVQANHGLHFGIYRAARMPALMPIIEGLWLRIGPVLNLDMRDSPERLRMGNAEACHTRLLTHLQARAPIQARAALQKDISDAAAFILSRGILVNSIHAGRRSGTVRVSGKELPSIRS